MNMVDHIPGYHYDQAAHAASRRATAPYLFTVNGSYKQWLHMFCIQRDRSGASVNANSHMTLPWELDEVLGPETLECLVAHYNLHGMRQWHPQWRQHWFAVSDCLHKRNITAALGTLMYDYMSNKVFWMLLPEPNIQWLCRYVADVKRKARIEGGYLPPHYSENRCKEYVERLLEPHLIQLSKGV